MASYVYCIVRAAPAPRLRASGIGERSPVGLVTHGDLAAVVSELPCATVEATREHLLAHERVNAAVLRRHTLLPMSFGMVFRSREDVVELLHSAHDTFAGVLDQVDGSIEFGLKVFRGRDAALPPDGDEADRLRQDIPRRLQDVCVASRCQPTVGDRMLLNAAFLVQRRREAAFERRLRAIAGDFEACTFQFSGPWPPYNFVTIRLAGNGGA